MAVREILKSDNEMLRRRCREVGIFDARLGRLLDDMTETLLDAHGVGLAAPQVGVDERVVVISDDGKIIELVDPVIIRRRGEQQDIEGCLSIPGVYGVTRRPMAVRVRARNRRGRLRFYTGTGLTARAFCHELDHLDGVLFTDNALRILTPEELEKSCSR
jgi:peptide deformylase